MMLFYYIFIVSLACSLAKEKTEEKTESKDKRQINQSVIYGQHIAGQYVNRPRQQEPEYYNGLHPEQPEQQQQQQQQQVEARASIKQAQIARPQQIQYQFLPQQQEQQYVPQQNIQSQIAQTQLSPSQLKLQEFQQQSSNAKPISEAEFLDLVKKSEADLRAATANQQKYAFSTVGQQKSLVVPQPQQSPGLGAYKNSLLQQSQSQQQQPPQPQIHTQQQLQPQQQVQPQQFIPQIQNPQSYKQSAAIQNPLGDFSLEKELEKLEASNKAIDELVAKYGNAKPNKFNFKSSQPAINNVPFKQQAQQPLFQQQQQKQQTQQYSFITPEISQFAQYQGKQPEKLIGQPQQQQQQQQQAPPQYIQEESGNAANAKINTEYNFQFLNSNIENNKRPQQISAAPLKYQYFSQDDENEQQQQQQQPQPQQQLTKLNQKSSNFKIVQSPQLQYDKLQQQQQQQQLQSIPNNFQYYKTPATSITKSQEIPLPQQQQPIAPSSHSSIYVSQTTGLRNKLIAQQQQQQQQQQLLQQQPQQEQTIITTKERIQSPVTLPPPNSKTPISQEEFQALVDAGFKVQAIPVPVPMQSGKYQQQQPQLQQQQRQFYQPIQESFQQNTNQIPRYQQPQNQQSILDYPNLYA